MKALREWCSCHGAMAIRTLLSCCGVYGVCCLCEMMGLVRADYSIMNLPLFFVIFALLKRTEADLGEIGDSRAKRRRIVFAAVTGFLFSVSMIMGSQLQSDGMTALGYKGKAGIFLCALCLSVAIFPFFNVLFQKLERIQPQKQAFGKRWKPRTVFGVAAVVIFLCLIPVWLAYYPIVMSYDFHRQVNEAYKGFAWFYPYQPIAHTWVIWVFLQLGKAFGSYQTGFACMAVFQMMLYALTAAYGAAVIYRLTGRKWPVVAAVLFFALFPINSVLVVCTTKDTLFTILFALFFLLLLERNLFSVGRRKLIIEILLVLEGSLMVQFRNNAFYAVAVFAVLFVLSAVGNERLRVLLLCVLLLAGGKGVQIMIKAAIGTQLEGAKIEAYSVPIQQFARVGCYQGEYLIENDPETAILLERYIPCEVWKAYNPPISDTVKGRVNGDAFLEDPIRLIKDWLHIGLQYPNEYLDAFLELTRGYWFWDDVSWAECLGSGVEGRMGAVYTYISSEIEGVGDIKHESKFPWLEQRLEEIVSGNCFYDWPLISVLFKSAFYSWSLFLLMMAFLYLRQKEHIVLGMFLFLYFGTMLLGPVVQIRYLFPVMITLPAAAALLLRDRGLSKSQVGKISGLAEMRKYV